MRPANAPLLGLAAAPVARSQGSDAFRAGDARRKPAAPPPASGPAGTPASPTPRVEPAPAPSTHSGTPRGSPSGPGAQDTTANRPQGDLAREQESSEMPIAGQANNYNGPAYEPKAGAGSNR